MAGSSDHVRAICSVGSAEQNSARQTKLEIFDTSGLEQIHQLQAAAVHVHENVQKDH